MVRATGWADRTSYHHGALRDALVGAGLELARTSGVEAIVLREATRRAGVTARAAYRHFADRDALVAAVADEALARMATWMARHQQGAGSAADLLRGVGEGYIGFALDEPGWFDVAVLAMPDLLSGRVEVDSLERSPCGMLLDALARLVADGVLEQDEVADAAVACWSGVHGFAMLTRGPLSSSPRGLVDIQAKRFVATLVAAVTSG
jgi:AcrR family transcriptional regulator